MAYIMDQFGRMVYQPDPPPMDRLQQLQAQRQMPQFQQATQQASQTWAYVQGEAAAKSWCVGNGQSVLLMDIESPVFYIKSADTSGMPLPLRTFEYREVTQNTAQAISQAVQKEPEDLDQKYVTRQEYDTLQIKYMEILERLNNFPAADNHTETAKRVEKASGSTRNKGGNANE